MSLPSRMCLRLRSMDRRMDRMVNQVADFRDLRRVIFGLLLLPLLLLSSIPGLLPAVSTHPLESSPTTFPRSKHNLDRRGLIQDFGVLADSLEDSFRKTKWFYEWTTLRDRFDTAQLPAYAQSEDQTNLDDASSFTAVSNATTSVDLNDPTTHGSRLDRFLAKYVREPYEKLSVRFHRLLNRFRTKPSSNVTNATDASSEETSSWSSWMHALSSVLPTAANVTAIDEQEQDRLQLYARYAAAAYCRKKKVLNWSCGYRCVRSSSATKSAIGLLAPAARAQAQREANKSAITVHDYFNMGFSATTGYILTDDNLQQIIISYRGSLALQNFLYDLMATAANVTFYGAPPEARVHFGFREAYRAVQDHVRNVTLDLLTRYPTYNITVVGHSFGGAVGLLTALDLHDLMTATGNAMDPSAPLPMWDDLDEDPAEVIRERYYRSMYPLYFDRARYIQVYTFGQPRIGNVAFAQYVQKKLQHIQVVRVTSYDDLVPQLPPRWLNYSHNGEREVWIPSEALLGGGRTSASGRNGGSGVLESLNCDIRPEDPRCSNGLSTYSVVTHLFYWGVIFGPWC